MKELFSQLQKSLLDDQKGKRILGICTYAVLCLIAVVMTVMNIITQKGTLTLMTAAFAALCLLDLGLTLIGERGTRIARLLFAAEILALFTYFLISGNPEGFSAIWICLLPSMGMLFFGLTWGSVLCAVMFFLMTFLLWFPQGNALLQYAYTASFKMRFPVLFVAFHLLAGFLESLRLLTVKELTRMQQLYREQSTHDQLTGMNNRQGMYALLDSDPTYQNTQLGAVMIDIDHFKVINDTYGHNAGDQILQDFTAFLQTELHTLLCRWGGEEFVAICRGSEVTFETLDRLRTHIEQHSFRYEGTPIRMTVSIGFCRPCVCDHRDVDRLIEKADDAMYLSKKDGRNRITFAE